MKIVIKPKVTLLTCIHVIYWLFTPLESAIAVVVDRSIATTTLNLLMLTLLVVYFTLSRSREHLGAYFMLYAAIALLIGVTILIHPEYSSWYSHRQYGITHMILELGGGIWAFLIIGLYHDEEKLLRDLKLITVLVFLVYLLKFIGAMIRGYWVIGDSHMSYDMTFGFRMLFVTAFWGAMGLHREKKYLAFYFVGLLLILMGGSRGAFVWALFLFVANIPFRFASLSVRQRRGVILLLLVILPVAYFVYQYSDRLIILIGNGLRALGISSRTIRSMALGSIARENGRNIIYEMSGELIRTGGPFGRGFYGDRPTIGQRFYWGYSHNIFLELMVTFGYVGGAVLSVLLVIGCVKLYKKANTPTRRTIFLTFFVNSLLLLTSNSFWYESSFWAMLALMAFWKRGFELEQNGLNGRLRLHRPEPGG